MSILYIPFIRCGHATYHELSRKSAELDGVVDIVDHVHGRSHVTLVVHGAGVVNDSMGAIMNMARERGLLEWE